MSRFQAIRPAGFFGSSSEASESSAASKVPPAAPSIARYSETQIQHAAPQLGIARAATDSFNIYGGRRSDGSNDRRPEGQFQNADLAPLWQDWFGVDRTENPVFWHIDTFNSANLDAAAGDDDEHVDEHHRQQVDHAGAAEDQHRQRDQTH